MFVGPGKGFSCGRIDGLQTFACPEWIVCEYGDTITSEIGSKAKGFRFAEWAVACMIDHRRKWTVASGEIEIRSDVISRKAVVDDALDAKAVLRNGADNSRIQCSVVLWQTAHQA